MVAGILAGLRLRDAMAEAAVYTRIERLATLGDRVAGLAQELEDERDTTVQYLSLGKAGRVSTLRDQQAATDRAVRSVRELTGGIDGDYAPQVIAKVRDIRYRLDTLAGVRAIAGQASASATSTLDIYSQLTATLLDFDDLIAQGSPNPDLAESTRAFAALARAKDFASQERARIGLTLIAGRFVSPTDRETLQTLRSQQDSQIALFRATATTAQRQAYEDTVTGPEIGQVESLYQQVLVRSGASKRLSVAPLRARTHVTWDKVATTRVEQMRGVEQQLVGSIVADSSRLKDDAWRGAFTDAGVLLVGLLLAGLATVVVARSLVRPLRRLQAGALEIAGTRLPGLVDRLRDPEAAAGGIEVEPIEIDSTDEIGQVARAFDEVHREAVRLAADEAVLRGNINAMFVNLSRRSQSLIERQLKLIEELEQSERDDEQLANLFRLDHLATRMRRNCENLLVLGGQDQVRRWNRPVPLIDVVRASLSEVEQYERVALRVQGDMTVAGPMVNDLVHLLAELVENATVFSAEHTKVTVSGQLLSGGGAMLQITDNGVGMSPDELEQANWRLANPPVIDFSAARRMGLFVVGRLAVRHGVRVELRAAQGGGLTAFVVLPDAVASAAEGSGVGGRGLAGREGAAVVGRPAQLASLTAPTAVADPPALGAGGAFHEPAPQDESGTGAHPIFGGTGPQPAFGGTGGQPVIGGTGPQRPIRGTGPLPAVGDTGSHRAFGDDDRSRPGDSGTRSGRRGTGPLPSLGGTAPLPVIGGTGPLPPVPPPGEHRTPDQAPRYQDMRGQDARDHDPRIQEPRNQDPRDQEPPYQDPREHDLRPGRLEGLPVRQPGAQLPARPSNGGQPGDGPNGFFDPAARQTGTQPVVPEGQPAVPEANRPRPTMWETGPLNQVEGPPAPSGRPGERQAPRPPARQQPMQQQPAQRPSAPPPQPPAQNPQRPGEPRRVPERSPIFDAMQSEWFTQRTGESLPQDPVKGWESPADAGFRAAEAAEAATREPAAGKRTAVGLPKRVPGKNRVPGAVARPPEQAEQRPQQPPQGGQARQERPAPPEAAQGPSADVVRNRFASLQRGVHRGRTETRGGGMQGEAPSHDDGESGGNR
ncbi:sensor histidine kinase [Actinomadura xylanilytica]|uniref:sensor histidine kinase n=1 Tax=Actinomadura xylanilytica TaxID=887459 RepID=UPI00255A9369|nr:nitrate- and nitrite sensing domain-containing protein [Actinomadura xylanilytica]MDL4774732.1 nitrate- and nitrite sensing domain-containing protein [Actinomadura xylanilytica]